MPIQVVFVTGPPVSGKSLVAEIIARDAARRPPHYIRLIRTHGQRSPVRLAQAPEVSGVASSQRVSYTCERVFEVLPEALTRARCGHRYATILVEADSDPILRHAYPYDARLFVMPAPGEVFTVFRTPAEAARALEEVMQDTAAFASEIFGLFESDAWQEEDGRPQVVRSGRGTEERLEISEQQARRFLASPLGAEIASRIQLRPEYHAIVESDVVVVNTAVGACSAAVDECVRRIDKLLARVRQNRRADILYCCDPQNAQDPRRRHLVEHLRTLLTW